MTTMIGSMTIIISLLLKWHPTSPSIPCILPRKAPDAVAGLALSLGRARLTALFWTRKLGRPCSAALKAPTAALEDKRVLFAAPAFLKVTASKWWHRTALRSVA